jgi:NAD(P)-dependent dehydrogenase (short-subunit alcohol dehydrogenase family)
MNGDIPRTPRRVIPLAGKVAVVTGGAQGIGRALVDELVQEQARAVVVFDRDVSGLAARREEPLGSGTALVACQGDVQVPDDLARMVRVAQDEFGRVDILCSNAGAMIEGGVEVPDPDWQRAWDVNVMAHVRAVRSVLPGMVSRHEGMILSVLSAAAFLTAPDAAPYTATKHAALGFAEWLAINFAHRGIRVCAVCPEAVDTQMLRTSLAGGAAGVQKIAAPGQVLSAAEVAASAIRSLKNGDFLVTTHPRTLRRAQRKWADIDQWVQAMNAFVAAESED